MKNLPGDLKNILKIALNLQDIVFLIILLILYKIEKNVVPKPILVGYGSL